jgi:hypothetical protein
MIVPRWPNRQSIQIADFFFFLSRLTCTLLPPPALLRTTTTIPAATGASKSNHFQSKPLSYKGLLSPVNTKWAQ